MISQERFYDSIFTWQYLIRNGYFDYRNSNALYKGEVSNDYGRDDIIDPTYFALDSLINRDVFSLIQFQEYFKYPEEKIRYIMDQSQLVKDRDVLLKPDKVNRVPNTSPIIFNIPKDNGISRKLKFPNVYAYLALIDLLIEHRNAIIKTLMSDINSTSKFFNINPYSFTRTKAIEENLLIGYEHFYKTDFSTFFHTFYTHTLAWIINSKENTKKSHYLNYFGNFLDSVIEKEQDGETHGVPTGNLATRIVIEYSMAFIDKELRDAFAQRDISFHRYVDDFTFAYNDEQDLAFIKKTILKIANKYELNLNSQKSSKKSYSELHRNSELIGYFDNLKLKKEIKIKDIQDYLRSYIRIAETEQFNGIKGSNKLIFTGIEFWLQKYNRSTNKNVIIQKKMLLALTYKLEQNEATVLDQLFEIAFLDSRVGIYYIRFVEKLFKLEKRLHSTIISSYFKIQFGNISFRKKYENRITKYVQNNKNQAYYNLIVILKKTGNYLSRSTIFSIFNEATKDDIEFDDFSGIILLQEFVAKYTKDVNNKISQSIIDCLHKLLVTEISSNYFTNSHWLLRYQVLFYYSYIEKFRNIVDAYYQTANVADKEKVLNMNCCKRYTGHNSDVETAINKFYFSLLDNKVSFMNLDSLYESSDI